MSVSLANVALCSAADATSHLFFAYLRSLSPETKVTGITLLPMSLQKLLQETEYPPQRPELMMSVTNKVLMQVDTVSPTPFALLRRGNHFQYRDDDKGLSAYAEYEDPVKALTEECRRVLRAISSANQSQVSSSKHSTSLRDASWSRFEDVGFSTPLEEEEEEDEPGLHRQPVGMRSTAASENGMGRPTTPSWADFMSSGFVDESQANATNMLLPPDKALPRIETTVRQRSSQSHRPRLETERHLEPGELASITKFDLDDAFWWVWMCSLAPEETAERKAAFGRCAVIETTIKLARWLVMEEMVVGSAPEPDAGAYIAKKKRGLFSWTRRGKTMNRSKSVGKGALDKKGDKGLAQNNPLGLSKTSIGPDQHARIQAAAAQLQAKQFQEERKQMEAERRGRTDTEREKTQSVMTLQPAIVNEASQALKWASKYDKEAIRDAYLADTSAGRGVDRSPAHTNGHTATNGSGFIMPPETPDQPLPEVPEKALETPSEVQQASAASPAPHKDETAPAPAENKASVESSSPESRRHKKLQKEKAPAPAPAAPTLAPSSGGTIRKLFGRKNRASKVPDNAAMDLNTMLQQDRVEPTHAAAAPEPAVAPEPSPVSPAPEKRATSPPGEVPHPEPTYNPSMHSVSEPDAQDVADANKEFARFDQGPLQDQPAFVPDDDSDSDDATPPPIARRAPEMSPPAPASERSLTNSAKDQATSDKPALERWAQIRKNAAERAQREAEAAKKEAASQREALVNKQDPDDDTSGEEST